MTSSKLILASFETRQKLYKYKRVWLQKCRRNNISGIIAIFGSIYLSVVQDINSCKHGLGLNISVNTNKIIGIISQPFFFINNMRVIFFSFSGL